MRLTERMIRDGLLNGGGPRKAQLALLGVKYPPRKGWIDRLVGREIHPETYRKFLALRRGSTPSGAQYCPRCSTVVHGRLPLSSGEVCPKCCVEARSTQQGCDLCGERDEQVRYFEDRGTRRCAACFAAWCGSEQQRQDSHMDALSIPLRVT